jgi:choline/glycine/proline betaine transport protein
LVLHNLNELLPNLCPAVAAVLLYSGGLQALKTASIVVALPFSVVLILATYGLCKSLYGEGKKSTTKNRF